MGSMSVGARRRPEDLSPAEHEELSLAHARLREAVAAAEPFRGGELPTNGDIEPKDGTAMARAYKQIDEAERELWALRERFLGWPRPVSAIPAREVTDWFSEEDTIYDEEV